MSVGVINKKLVLKARNIYTHFRKRIKALLNGRFGLRRSEIASKFIIQCDFRAIFFFLELPQDCSENKMGGKPCTPTPEQLGEGGRRQNKMAVQKKGRLTLRKDLVDSIYLIVSIFLLLPVKAENVHHEMNISVIHLSAEHVLNNSFPRWLASWVQVLYWTSTLPFHLSHDGSTTSTKGQPGQLPAADASHNGCI